MATAKQRAWRAKFAKLYGRKKTRSTSTRSPSKGRTTMARRKSSKRRTVGARVGRSYRKFRAHRSGVIPVMDTLHGIYTLDGMTDGRIHQAGENYLGAVAGTSGMSFDNGNAHLAKGASWALKNPKGALMGGFKNFAEVWVARKVMGLVGIPRTVKLLGKKIQVR